MCQSGVSESVNRLSFELVGSNLKTVHLTETWVRALSIPHGGVQFVPPYGRSNVEIKVSAHILAGQIAKPENAGCAQGPNPES